MTYQELKENINYYNAIHTNNRFAYNPDTKMLLIGTYHNPIKFSEDDYKTADEFINEYGMLKRDEDCFGNELYYKGLKWNELTDAQRQSVIDLYKDSSLFITDDSSYEELFNDNLAFLAF